MICNCVLPYYNPDACKTCPVYYDSRTVFPPTTNGFVVIKTKRVTERYDKYGNLVEKIIEEGVNQ